MSLTKELETLKSGKSFILITEDEKYFKAVEEILIYLTKKKKLSGVYISVAKPYDKVKSEIKRVDWNKILFLDAVSKGMRKKEPESENCVFLQGPTSLTEMGICMTKAILGGADFLIVDSLSSILVHNPEKTALRFAQYVSAKSESLEMVGIVVLSKKDEELPVVRAIKEVVDRIIRV